MIRLFGTALSLAALALAVFAAQDPNKEPAKEPEPVLKKKTPAVKKAEPANPDPKDKEDPKDKKDLEPKELKKIGPGDLPNIGTGEKPEEIIARIKKNLGTVAKSLDEKDAGDNTRKKQRDIVKDLDDLINRNDENNNNNQGGQGGNAGNQGGQGGTQGRSGRRQGNRQATKNQNPQSQKENSEDKKNTAGQDKKEKKQNAGQQKDKEGGDLFGKRQDSKSKKPSDLRTDIWGHLPQHKRVEMEAYMQEGYLQRYGPVLHQYFKTISEKKK